MARNAGVCHAVKAQMMRSRIAHHLRQEQVMCQRGEIMNEASAQVMD